MEMSAIGSRKWRFSFPLIILIAWATGTTVVGQDSLVLVPGDVMIAAMFRTNDVFKGECSDYDVRSLQEMMAVMWFVDSVNKMDNISNVTVGLEVYRTCKMSAMANKGVVNMLNKYNVGGEQAAENSTLLFGLIGPDRTAEATSVSRLIGSMPTNQRLVQVSGSATGDNLSEKELYPNFFRVIPSDAIQIKVILNLVLQLQWNYVAIVYSDDDYGRSAATELRSLAEAEQVCVALFAGLPLDTGTEDFSRQRDDIAGQLQSKLVRGVIFVGGRSTALQLLSALHEKARFVQLIFSEALGFQTDSLLTPTVMDVSTGSLLTALPILHVPEFAPVWNQLWRNRTFFQLHAATVPWLRNYYRQIVNCDFPDDEGCWDDMSSVRAKQTVSEEEHEVHFSLYLGYQVKAAAVMISLLKRVLEESCGSAFQGLCPAARDLIAERTRVQDMLQAGVFRLRDFDSISSNLSNLSVAFDDRGDVRNLKTDKAEVNRDVTNLTADDTYHVYNLKKDERAQFQFCKVGEYSSGQLSVESSAAEFYDETGSPLTWAQLPLAQCPQDRDCLSCERDVSNDIIFLEGDFYIVAILPIHAKDPEALLKCGEVKGIVGADLMQAVVFAVGQVNNKSNEDFRDVLPGRRVGLIGISSCSSSLVAVQRVMDLYSGRLPLPDGRTSSALLPYLMGVLGAYNSGISIAVSDTLSTLGTTFVQVSAASTSSDLKDRTRHPYFMRFSTADDTQTLAILDIAKKVGANYIQVIYDGSTAYATGLFKNLREQAKDHGVCIAQGIATTPYNDVSQYKYIVDLLRDKSAAKIVAVFQHVDEINKTMAAILPLLLSEKDNFLFMASASWGRRTNLIEDRELLEGSLVLSQEITKDKTFKDYLDRLDPVNSVNPWMKYFWETRLNCYLEKSFLRKGKSGPCPKNVAAQYTQDPRLPAHIQAVYALAKGFHTALLQHCGSDATRVCESLTSSKLVSAMHKVKLDLFNMGNESSVFDSNGDGVLGFKVLQITRKSAESSMIFREVGQWTDEGLELELDLLKPVVSVCPNARECDRCFPSGATTPQPNMGSTDIDTEQQSQTDGGLSVSGVAGIAGGLGIIILVLSLVIVCLVKRRRSLSDPYDSLNHRRMVQGNGQDARIRYVPPTSPSDYDSPNELSISAQHFVSEPPPPPACSSRQRLDYLTPVGSDGNADAAASSTDVATSAGKAEFDNESH